MSRRRMLDDLKRSGLTEYAARKMQLQVLSPEETRKLTRRRAASYRIPYFDINGNRTGYYRIRFLEQPRAFGETPEKVRRYHGPTGRTPEAYFPPGPDWPEIVKDSSVPIWITEGEKKAATACLAGVACIGIGGVAMFQSSKRHINFLNELASITWNERKVFVAFDSDKNTNTNVLREQNRLATRLLERGARVYIIDIPEERQGVKAGIDDYLFRFHKKHRPERLHELTNAADEYEMSAELWKIQEEAAYIEKAGSIFLIERAALSHDINRISKLDFAGRFFTTPPSTEGGEPKRVRAFDAWLDWSKRRTHADIIYAPGQQLVTQNNCLNLWPGWGCVPKEGTVDPFVELVDFLFEEEPHVKTWFWQWLAYPLQHPGTKLYSAVLLHGPTQGTGKTFLGEIVGDIYGKNFTTLSSNDLFARFNDAFASKQFALCDEILGAKERRAADRIKSMITQESLRVEQKYQDPYTIRDTINYLFTSNHADAIYIQPEDRRFLVVAVPDRVLSNKFYARLREWREAGGPSCLFESLLRLDLSGFLPYARPPATKSHADMVEAGASALELWVQDLTDNPDRVLGHPKELWEPSALLDLYDKYGNKGTSLQALAKALRRANHPKLRVRSKLIGPVRLYAIRNPNKWRSLEAGQWISHYDKHLAPTQRMRRSISS